MTFTNTLLITPKMWWKSSKVAVSINKYSTRGWTCSKTTKVWLPLTHHSAGFHTKNMLKQGWLLVLVCLGLWLSSRRRMHWCRSLTCWTISYQSRQVGTTVIRWVVLWCNLWRRSDRAFRYLIHTVINAILDFYSTMALYCPITCTTKS